MNYLRLLGILILFVLVGLGTVGGCGSSGGGGGGEGCCVIGPDACVDGTNQAECDLLEGVLDKGVLCGAIPECGDVPPVLGCEDIEDAFCEKSAECIEITVELCLLGLDIIKEGNELDCEEIFNLSSAQDCVADLDNFDCPESDLNIIPASCSPEGVCNICETDNDCDASQLCFECFEDCTGEVDRCASALFSRCEDGVF